MQWMRQTPMMRCVPLSSQAQGEGFARVRTYPLEKIRSTMMRLGNQAVCSVMAADY